MAGIIYVIKVRNSPESKKTGYIGQDLRATKNYYPRAFEHVLSGYNLISDGQSSDKFIGEVGAYKCDFLIFDEENSYGLDNNKFELFKKTWTTSQPDREKLDWAEICWIYWYNRSYASQNDEWGAQSTLTYNLKGLQEKLDQANVSQEFKNGLLETLQKNPITWSSKRDELTRENLYKLFYPEEVLIKQWIKNGLAEFLTSKDLFNKAFKAAIKKWDGVTLKVSEDQKINLTQFLKEELKKHFNPTHFQKDLKSLQTVLDYSISFSLDQSVIDQLAEDLSIVILINQDGTFSVKQSGKINTAVDSIFQAHLGLRRKEYPKWLSRGQVSKGTSIDNIIKQSTVQYAWPQLAENIVSVSNGPDILSLKEKIPFVEKLVGTDNITILNGLIQNIKQDSPIEPFGQEWQMFMPGENNEQYIYFRRGAWSPQAKAKIDYKNYARIKQLNEDSLSSWTIW